jgi:hypothetical protein
VIEVEGAKTPPKMLRISIVRGQVRGCFSKSCGCSGQCETPQAQSDEEAHLTPKEEFGLWKSWPLSFFIILPRGSEAPGTEINRLVLPPKQI